MNTNLALYRKYRPGTFSEIVGQEHIVRTLTNEIKNNKISHAYLFIGPRGSGKTTIGRLLAKAANCQVRKQGEFEPCNECSSCKEIRSGNAIDLIEIDAASNRGIDEIRNLKEGIGFVPVKSKYKVFILDEAHQLSKDAANALLKTLEEPPRHAIFILATTEGRKMLATIVSRCQRFDFRRLTLMEITRRLEEILKKEKIAYEKEALALIALSANGSIRDGETILDQVVSFCGADKKIEKKEVEELLGLADKEMILGFLELLADKKAKEAIVFLNDISFKGVALQEFVSSLVGHLREFLILKIIPDFPSEIMALLDPKEKQRAGNLREKLSEKEMKFIIETLSLAKEKIKYADIPQLPLELAIIDICLKNQ